MLTGDEKVAGRAFRAAAEAALAQTFVDNPPTYTVPNVLALFRHVCPRRDGRSTALELKEIYQRSPGYVVYHTIPPTALDDRDPDLDGLEGTEYTCVPAGRFAFVTKQGRCRGCGQTARSKTGRLVDGRNRPPIQGRVARS